MSSDDVLDSVKHADDFLKDKVYSQYSFSPDNGKLQAESGENTVTLTYAQSLDAKIAGRNGKQIQLSGPESAVMTHRLRAIHSHILVGIGTLLNDDPQLNCRLPSLLPLERQPIPCILDYNLRTPITCKLIQNAQKGIGHRPIIITQAPTSAQDSAQAEYIERRKALEQVGCEVRSEMIAAHDGSHTMSLSSIVKAVNGSSLMIEGGALVISSILSSADGVLPHRLIVTVAPNYVGNDGVRVDLQNTVDTRPLQHIVTEQFGRDSVVVRGRPSSAG